MKAAGDAAKGIAPPPMCVAPRTTRGTSMLLRLIVPLLLVTLSGLASAPSAHAAGRSAAAIEKSFHAYFNAGNYAAALVEAQELAPLFAQYDRNDRYDVG
jgi:hypothetical protein